MSFEFHINGNQTTFFILFVLRSCTFGFADYMVSYLPGAGKRSLPESRERPFPEARTYVREKYMGRRSASGCRTNTGELFWAGRGTGSFGDSRSPVFRLSFRPDVRFRPCSLTEWSAADAGTGQPVRQGVSARQ